MALKIVLLLVACFAFVPRSECQLFTDCGERSCPNEPLNPLARLCCVERRGCCVPGEEEGVSNETPMCDGMMCPSDLLDDFYDDDDQLRNECCVYFRSGCCSREENETLNLLFQLAIGLSIGLFGLLVIIVFLVVCCCCCCC